VKGRALALLLGLALGCTPPAVGARRPATERGPGERTVGKELPVDMSRSAAVAAVVVGPGTLEAEGEKTGKTRLAVERLGITATTAGDFAETTVEQVFRNDTGEQLEGTFHFPLPEGAIVLGLAMEMNGKLVDGELVERAKARKAYEETVDKMLDPALLEWEGGQSFKVRVFPIEARSTKRIALRFLAPLHRTSEGLFFVYRPPSADAGPTTEQVRVTLDGKDLTSGAGTKAPTGEVLVKMAASAPAVVVEHTKKGDYVSARLDLLPVDARAAASTGIPPKALIVLCDRSRSMLEARALEARTTSLLLDELGPADRFAVVTGDVTTQGLPGGLRAPTRQDKQQAAAFVDRTEPDGASDLGSLLEAGGRAADQARSAGLAPVLVYLGDATATWGQTKAADLEHVARERLRNAPLHLLLLGKSTDDVTAGALAGATHGRLLRPKTEDEARSAAMLVVHADRSRRLDDVHLVGAAGLDAAPSLPGTIYEGDEVRLSFFVPAGTPTAELSVAGTLGATPFTQRIDIRSAKEAAHVAERWANAKIALLEREGDTHKDDVIKTSLDHGVMSRYTSFLVLESDEAYARMNIARKSKQADPDTHVSGQDLESADGRTASVTPDHLQPGDPEVRIPAPADALSVVAVFPFGETKTATFEPDEGGGTWVVRFLVDRHTPDGTYEILVRITHHDGGVELVKIPYVVDTRGPNLNVTLRPTGRTGAFAIVATQVLTADEIAAQTPPSPATLAEKRSRFAAILTDAKRVEVRTPDGQVLNLTHVTLGQFRGVWTPKGPVPAGSTVHVVAVDRALNETETDAKVP
jgi:hypothetical protein